jgi:ESS family glutamate:Na+ symporter
MDYSAANSALWNIVIQFGIIAAAILLATFLRRKIGFFRRSLLPTAVLAGFLLLILRAVGALKLDTALLEMTTYHGIAIGFIAMTLRVQREGGHDRAGVLTGTKSGALIVSTYLMQAIVGIILCLILSWTILPGLFKAAGVLLPMGYGQGPGQANNLGSTYEALGFAGGRSFGLSLAAAGYLSACIVGVLMLNVLSRKGRLRRVEAGDLSGSVTVDTFQDQGEIPISESLDKLSMQVSLILICYLLTYLVIRGVAGGIAAILPGAAATVNSLLWGFNFIIASLMAILLKVFLGRMKRLRFMERQYQNNYLLNRISGFAFDLMIVAGIASIELEDLRGLLLPFLVLAVAGAACTWFYLSWLCKKVYPAYSYEALFSMYGMLTGTISSGVLLLREIDPEYQTPAANNLVLGSSFGIAFGFPVLILVGMAPKSDLLLYLVLGICLVYLALLMLVLFRVGRRAGAETDPSPNAGKEE